MIDRGIKFRHIQCLVEIFRQKSLKQAAERLFQIQPAISKTLKEPEEILGAELLIRNRAGIVLTKEGEVFLLFAEIAPRSKLEIVAGSYSDLIDQLRVGVLGLVIVRLGRPALMQGISFTQLYEEKVIFVVRAGHPLLDAPELPRIGAWQVIYPPKDTAIHPLVERFLIGHGVGELPNRLDTVSGAFARVYVPKSDAVWIISAGVVANELQSGQLVELPFDTHVTRGPVGLMR